MATKPPTPKLPKTLALCADRLYALKAIKAIKADAKAVVAGIEAEESALTLHLITSLPKTEATGIQGTLCRVSVVPKSVPQVTDWDEFWAKFKVARDRDLIQKRLSSTAVAARWESGKHVPGVEEIEILTLSINKV